MTGGMGGTGRMQMTTGVGGMNGKESVRSTRRTCLAAVRVGALALCLTAVSISPAFPAPPAGLQVTFEKTLADLNSPDPGTRLRAVRLLKGTGYPEASVPMAALIADPFDEIQLEAIAAELNIFLADKVTPKRRVGLLVEVRSRIAAEAIFSSGPSAIGPMRVPQPVLTALANASRDPNARVAVEALYAFGALAGDATPADRPGILAQSGPVLAATIGATDPVLRIAAVRVIGRVFARRLGDPPIEETVGDAVITALNDREAPIKETAMWALGIMKYERAIQGLNELFQFHQRGPLAEAAFDALGHIGHPSSLPQFVAQLNAKNVTYKMIAIEGLARTGDRTRAEGIVNALANDRNEAILLAGHFANVKLSDGPVDPIVEALSRTKLRNRAFQYLQELAPGRVASFVRHLQDPDARIRLDVVEALGLAGDPAALPLVEPMLNDRDGSVAQAAARATARLRATRVS